MNSVESSARAGKGQGLPGLAAGGHVGRADTCDFAVGHCYPFRVVYPLDANKNRKKGGWL